MSIRIFTRVELSVLLNSASGDQLLVGTKNIWLLSFCVDRLPVAGQVTLLLESLAKLSGRFVSLYTCPMLCFSIGPSFGLHVVGPTAFIAKGKDIVLS